MKRVVVWTVALIASTVAVGLPVSPASAAVFPASDETTLRDALVDAAASGTVDSIALSDDISLTACAVEAPTARVPATGDLDYEGATDLVIEGNGYTITQTCADHRVLHLRTTAAVTLRNLTISGGDQTGTSFVEGGGVLSADAPVTLDSAHFTGNTVTGGEGSLARGGAIMTDAPLIVLAGSTFTANHAIGGAGADGTPGVAGSAGGGGNGGAIYAESTLTVAGSTFAGNAATGAKGGDGAAGIVGAEGFAGTAGTAGSDGGQGGSASGAAIYGLADVTVTNSAFTGSTATAGAGGNGGPGGNGGNGTSGAGGNGGDGGAGKGAGSINVLEIRVSSANLSLTDVTSTSMSSVPAVGGAGGAGGAGGSGSGASGGVGGVGGTGGGGSRVQGTHGRGDDVTLTRVSITSWTSSAGNGGTGGSGGVGGAGTPGGAGGSGGTGGAGGRVTSAVEATNAGHVLTATDVTIDDYTVVGGSGATGGNGALGGSSGGAPGVGGDGGNSLSVEPEALSADALLTATRVTISNITATAGSAGTGGGAQVVGGTGGIGGGSSGGAMVGDSVTATDSVIENVSLTAGSGGIGGNGLISGGDGGPGGAASAAGIEANIDAVVSGTKINNVSATAGVGGLGASGGNGGAGGDGSAAGVSQVDVSGSLSLDSSSITNSSAAGGDGGDGGSGTTTGGAGGDASDAGLHAAGVSSTIVNSTIANNSVAAGAGGSGNTPGASGTADVGGANVDDGSISHSTIAGNSGDTTGNLRVRGDLTADAAVIASPASGVDCTVAGSTTSSHSASTDGTCSFVGGSDLGTKTAGELALAALADNGGITLSMMPGAASVVLDASDCAGVIAAPAVDQIGILRPQGSGCDAGAIERDANGPVVTNITVTPDPSTVGDDLTVKAQLDDAEGSAITGVNVDFAPKTAKTLTITADDGSFNSSSEAMTAVLTDDLTVDLYTVCITATDVFGNSSAVTCKDFTVNAAAPPPDPGAACPDPVANFFTDDNGNLHEVNINCIAFWKVTTGKGGGIYDPLGNVTRAQMATFLVNKLRTAGVTIPTNAPDAFVDDDGNTHEANINILKALGVTGGKGPGIYDPLGFVTRAQMATFIANAVATAKGSALTPGIDAFTDDNGNTHEANINALAAAGIVGGKGGGLYAPNDFVRRDQMGTFIANSARELFKTGDWPSA